MNQNFGFNQISNTTPSWAKWFFRVVFLFNKIIVAYIAATNLIDPSTKYEITLFLSLVVDPLAFGFSKMFGINLDDKKEQDLQASDEPIDGGGVVNDPKTKP